MTDPVLTVITPTYNRADYLDETIESVLFQNLQGTEYLIIDDGSKDNTAEVVKKYLPPDRPSDEFSDLKITYLRHDNIGETRTVNKALQLVRGEFFTIVNSDDPLVPGSFARMIDALRAHPESLAAYPDWHVIGPDSAILHTVRLIDYDFRSMLAHGFVSIGPGAIFRRSALDLVGYRNPLLRYSADLDYWYRVALSGPIVHVPEALATHRVHRESASISDKGTRLADETAYAFYVYKEHPLRPKSLKSVRGLALAHGHFAAIFASSTLKDAACHLAKGVLAHPIGLIRRARAHSVDIKHLFEQLGGAPNGTADSLFPRVLGARTRIDAVRPLVRGVLADPIGMLAACEEHGADEMIGFIRRLPFLRSAQA